LLYVVDLAFVVFVSVERLHCGANELNQDDSIFIIWIFLQEQLIALELVDQARDWVVGVNAAHDQRPLPILERLQSVFEPFLICFFELFDHELSEGVLHAFEDLGLRELLDELFVHACVSNPDPYIVSMEVDAEAATFEEFKFQATHSLASLDEVAGICK